MEEVEDIQRAGWVEAWVEEVDTQQVVEVDTQQVVEVDTQQVVEVEAW